MKQTIHFTKMHGAGNDYIYVDTSLYYIENPAAAAIAWSDRHKGIGSDGLVLIGRSSMPEADFTMRIFNADGSEAMMCGNACRCIGKYVYEKGLTTNLKTPPQPLSLKGDGINNGGKGSGSKEMSIRLLTLSGIKTLFLHINDDIVENVTVDMGEPVFEDKKQYDTSVAQQLFAPHANWKADESDGLFISMGNPHYVIFVKDVDAIDVAREGAILEHHPAFPERANIEFAEMRPDGIRVRVWERGSGITMACGTGACATAVAACKTGRAGRTSRIIMDGGELEVEWRENDNHVYMRGPATFVFEGDTEMLNGNRQIV